MTCRILCLGDIHLGRRPARLPAELRDHGVRPEELTPMAAWHEAVGYALASEVDGVLLAGDVIESPDDRIEAFAHLERGVAELTAAGIRVCGVAGNHDVEALPRLAARLPGFKLIGRGGTWETAEFETRSGDRWRVRGWSFPRERVTENPLASLMAAPHEGIPTLGLLHCDRGARGGPYAPVPQGAFEELPGDAWLLGHIHKPDALAGPRPVGYLGSIAGLTSADTGARGPWLLEVHGPGHIDAEHLPLAPLRWERETVDIDDLERLVEVGEAAEHGDRSFEDALFDRLVQGLERIHLRVAAAATHLRAVGCRLTLRGRSAHHARLRPLLASARFEQLTLVRQDVLFFLEGVVDEAQPAIDLFAIARGNDPPALLARRILALQSDDGDGDELVARAERELAGVRDDAVFHALEAPADARRLTRELLLRSGIHALEHLLGQRVDGDER